MKLFRNSIGPTDKGFIIVLWFTTIRSKLENIHYYLVLILSFLIPFNKWIPEFSCIVFIIWLFSCRFNVEIIENQFLNTWMLAAPVIGFFFWLVISSFFPFSMDGLNHVIRYLGIFIFPLIFFQSGAFYFDEKRKINIIGMFLLGCMVTNLWSLIYGMITKKIFYTDFPRLPSEWYTVQLIISIILSMYTLYTIKLKTAIRVVLYAVILSSFISLYLLSARGLILSAVAALLTIAVGQVMQSEKNRKRIIFSMVAVCIIFFLNPRFYLIVSEGNFGWRNDYWSVSVKTVTRNLKTTLMGLGVKKGISEYNKNLIEHNKILTPRKGRTVSSHNDFLDIFLFHGIVGLILFLSIFFGASIYAVKRHNILFLSFITMATVQFIFGSYYFWFRSGKYLFFYLFFFLLLFDNSFIKASKGSRNASQAS